MTLGGFGWGIGRLGRIAGLVRIPGIFLFKLDGVGTMGGIFIGNVGLEKGIDAALQKALASADKVKPAKVNPMTQPVVSIHFWERLLVSELSPEAKTLP